MDAEYFGWMFGLSPDSECCQYCRHYVRHYSVVMGKPSQMYQGHCDKHRKGRNITEVCEDFQRPGG